jgi:cytochrome P450
VGGYRLRAGVTVNVGIALVHASDALYPDPDRFDPDRMLGATLSPTTWLPFGGGSRRCLGAGFSLVEMRVVLREILRQAELCTTTAPGERQTPKHVTTVPHRGARIEVRAIRDITSASQAAETAGCPANVRSTTLPSESPLK